MQSRDALQNEAQGSDLHGDASLGDGLVGYGDELKAQNCQ